MWKPLVPPLSTFRPADFRDHQLCLQAPGYNHMRFHVIFIGRYASGSRQRRGVGPRLAPKAGWRGTTGAQLPFHPTCLDLGGRRTLRCTLLRHLIPTCSQCQQRLCRSGRQGKPAWRVSGWEPYPGMPCGWSREPKYQVSRLSAPISTL